MWTGFGVSVVALIGLTACAFVPSHASAKPSHDVSAFAFNPPFPGTGLRSTSTGIRQDAATYPQRKSTALKMSEQVGEDAKNFRRAFLGKVGTAAMGAALMSKGVTPANAIGPKGVFFKSPKDGADVPRKFTAEFGLNGYALSPASEGLKSGTGHHHVIIDSARGEPFVLKGVAIPMDATHKHYGKAQTSGEFELEPGKHTLTLQLGNAYHESYGPEFEKTITVNVVD